MNIFTAIYDFIATFASGIPLDNIFRGYQNRVALPQEQTYAVITLADMDRVGTNILDQSNSGSGEITSKVMRVYTVDVDFISLDQSKAQRQASVLENFGRTYIATDFFEKYNLYFNYVDDISYLPFIDETDQYLHRYRISLHFSTWDETTTPQQYAERVEIQRVENIDAHHKP